MDLFNILSINGIDIHNLCDTKIETEPDFYIQITSGDTADFNSKTSTLIKASTPQLKSNENMVASKCYVTFYKNNYNKIIGFTIIVSPSSSNKLPLGYNATAGKLYTFMNYVRLQMHHLEFI